MRKLLAITKFLNRGFPAVFYVTVPAMTVTCMDMGGAIHTTKKFRPVRPGKVVHLLRWTSFFCETFPDGPNRSIEFWTEISGEFWLNGPRPQRTRSVLMNLLKTIFTNRHNDKAFLRTQIQHASDSRVVTPFTYLV